MRGKDHEGRVRLFGGMPEARPDVAAQRAKPYGSQIEHHEGEAAGLEEQFGAAQTVDHRCRPNPQQAMKIRPRCR